MKVAVLHGAGDLRLDDLPEPTAGRSDVVVQVKCAGICGTDLGFFAVGTPTGAPVPLGHELSGIVVEAGEAVTAFEVGDRVILNPLVNMVGNGGPEGGFAERLLIRDVVLRPNSLIRLPDRVGFEAGALVEPLSVSLHAVNRARVQPGAKVAIFGAGPVGIGLVLALRLQGIEDIVVFDLSSLRRNRAVASGARAAFDPRDRLPADVLKELHGVELFFGVIPVASTDLYFDAAGASGLLADIISHARTGANIVVAAVYKKPVTLDLQAMLGKEISLITASGYPTEMSDVVDMLDKSVINLDPLVSHRFGASEFLKAFEVARDTEESVKVLINFT